MQRDTLNGLLNLDKPAGLTSRRVVDQIARLVRPAAAGHAGTLDPLATGVLVVCVGRATRLAQYVQRMPKHYRAGFRLGVTSDTDDAEGQLEPVQVDRPPTREQIEALLTQFVGEIKQRPPAYSAVRVEGRRAYQRARRGETVTPKPRRITIYEIKLTLYAYPDLELEIECGSGTYIRAIGRDLGEKLGCGAVMQSLQRTAIGGFRVEEAVEPKHLTRENLPEHLLPPARAVEDLPTVSFDTGNLSRLAHGLSVALPEGMKPNRDEIAIVDEHGELIAIARCDVRSRTLAPKRVLISPS